jgi:transcriptional regulator with XRE-family HTH domain
MESRRLSQADLARQAGMSRSYISRLFSGDEAALTDENMLGLLKVFSGNQHMQAELVAARCMDVRNGPGSEAVEISVKRAERGSGPSRTGQDDKVLDKVQEVQLGEEAEKAFAWLRSQCPVNGELEKHLIAYAKLMGMK